MRQVRGEDPVQVAVVSDQDPVQAFGPNGAHPAFGVGVRPGRPRWDLECLDASCGEHRVERRGELGVSVADQETEPVGPLVRPPRVPPSPRGWSPSLRLVLATKLRGIDPGLPGTPSNMRARPRAETAEDA